MLMIEKITIKYKLNVDSMIKNGSVAVITMLGVGIIFGMENIMIAFPIALTSTVLGRQNFYVKPISKVINIIAIDLLIVLAAYFASINIWMGLVINLISIFLILYLVTSPYEPTFFKPFIMLYVFTQYATIQLDKLPARLLAVIFGITIVAVLSIIKKGDEKQIVVKIINATLKLLRKQMLNILEGKFDHALEERCTKSMMDLSYRIYITRHKKYLTTNLGIIQFNIFLYIEELNLYLREVNSKYKEGKIERATLEEIIFLLINLSQIYKNNNEKLDHIYYKLEEIKSENINCSYDIEKLIDLIKKIAENIVKLTGIDIKTQNKIYEHWQRSDLDMPIVLFKEHFNKDSIRFKFAIRMSIALSVALLIGDILGMYKIIWAIITIMSIMQPYYEDTILKAKDRVVGNVAAIIFTGVVINIVDNKIITILLLVCALYLLYGFKEYYKISFFAAIASICIASLTKSVNILIVYRIVYVIVGVVAVLLANRFLFPYKLSNGIEQLQSKIRRYDKILIEKVKKGIDNKVDESGIRDLIIHITLLTQKLYLRNLQYNSEEIQRFIEKNNQFVIELGYTTITELVN